MKTWTELAVEINAWALRNYGVASEPWQLYLGVIEEVGEFVDHRSNNSREGMIDSLGDQAVYALNLAHTLGVEFPEFDEPKLILFDTLIQGFGAGARGLLKMSQGIRGYDQDKTRRAVQDSLVCWRKWANQQTRMYALGPLRHITNGVWDVVCQRNWKTNPTTGVAGESWQDIPPKMEVQEPKGEDSPERQFAYRYHPVGRCADWPQCEDCGPPRL